MKLEKQDITLLTNKQKLSYKNTNGGISVTIPKSLRKELLKQAGFAIKMSAQ
jgi:alpha-L-fucosidase